ncbi:hypothetical protein M2408_000638 [Sphingobacterium sp. BIGb0165]|nr:hypothetical protein [Sphingobacterium sp. BIGb0165]
MGSWQGLQQQNNAVSVSMIGMDDATKKSMLNYRNAIHIAEFTGNPNNNGLLLLPTYLKKGRECSPN